MKKELVLVLGGARAGKSAFAQTLAQEMGSSVVFVATAQALDDEMKDRVRLHKVSRPSQWHTLEEPLDPSRALGKAPEGYDLVLLDCLTLWVSNLLLRNSAEHPKAETQVLDSVAALLDWYKGHPVTLIIVSNEVGMGIVPDHPLGRQYRDLLGVANQMVAARASRVYLMVAGLPLELKHPPMRSEAQ